MAKTGKGVFRYCHLNKPDTKFSAEGEYSVSVVFDHEAKATQRVINELEALQAEKMKEAKELFKKLKPAAKQKMKAKGIDGPIAMPIYEILEDDEGDPTGQIAIRFKTKAAFPSKKNPDRMIKKVVPFFDGKGEMIADSKRPLVYSGTEGAVDFNANAVYIQSSAEVYVSCYLNSIRISKLVTAGSAAGGDWDEDEDSDFDGSELEEYIPEDDDDGIEEGSLDADLDDDLDDSAEAEEGDNLDDEIPF